MGAPDDSISMAERAMEAILDPGYFMRMAEGTWTMVPPTLSLTFSL